MNFIDKNQTHEPPEGYQYVFARAQGAFLCVQYRQDLYWAATKVVRAQNIIEIFLNDMGREVARTQVRVETPPPAQALVSLPVARRFKIWNGILIIVQTIQEMFQ